MTISGVAEILNAIAKMPTKEEKIWALRDQANRKNEVLLLLLKMSMDPGLQWKIPEGVPPFRPAPVLGDIQGMLYAEARRLYLFIEDPRSKDLSQAKREKLWIELLEHVHPDDAQLLINVRDKKPLAKGITRKLVEEALPGLLQ